MRKLAKTLKNKKGFTLVEAIAVVAIMGILATVIGGLVTAGTTAYMRQKENAAAKDLGTIVQNEIKRAARSSVEVYLQDGELPRDSNTITIDDNQTTYQMKNAPTGEYKVFSSSEDGRLVYSTDSGNTTENTKDYFTSTEAEKRAFYGSFKIEVYFRAIVNTFGEITSVKVFCDVFNAKGQKNSTPRGLKSTLSRRITANRRKPNASKVFSVFSRAISGQSDQTATSGSTTTCCWLKITSRKTRKGSRIFISEP